jgi:putative phosphoribosyl transferase
MFADREEAGRRLAVALARFQAENPCVLALPRGGVPVGFEVAKALHAPLDLVLVRKIGVPSQPELAAGAVVDGRRPEVVLNEEIVALFDVPPEYLAAERANQLKEIERRRLLYLGGRGRLDVAGRTALIVDDGIATGATIRAALRATRRAGAKRVVLAVPVAPADVLMELRKEADEVVCLEASENFVSIGFCYEKFTQLNDSDVQAFMARVATGGSGDGARAKTASGAKCSLS